MKKVLIILIAALLVLPGAVTALAGGGGPPKDMLKGVFTQFDAATGAATFVKDGTGEVMHLTLGSAMSAGDIRVDKKVMVSLDKHADEGVIKEVSVMFMDMTVKMIVYLIIIGLIGGILSGFIASVGAVVLTPVMISPGVAGDVPVLRNMFP